MPVVDVGIVVVLRLLSIAPRQQLPILLLRLQQIFLYFFCHACTKYLGYTNIDFQYVLCALWPELNLLNRKINGFSCKYLGHGSNEAGSEHSEHQAGNQLQHEAIEPQIQLEE